MPGYGHGLHRFPAMGLRHVSLNMTFLIYKIISHISFLGVLRTSQAEVCARLLVDVWSIGAPLLLCGKAKEALSEHLRSRWSPE